jgi:hypothetical protein
MNRLTTAKRVQVVSALVKGVSINATCRMTGVAKHTVLKLLEDMGCAAAAYHHRYVRGVKVHRLQCDEIWSFVAFSKKLDNHGHALALYFLHYNFCRVHKTLRVTPAMEAGLASHVWSMEELVGLLEGKCKLPPKIINRLPEEAGPLSKLNGMNTNQFIGLNEFVNRPSTLFPQELKCQMMEWKPIRTTNHARKSECTVSLTGSICITLWTGSRQETQMRNGLSTVVTSG